MKKELSVVIPIFKVENYIADTINSLIKQSYKDFEVILVDDSSPDNSVKIATEILDREKIDYTVYSQENTGLGGARASGQKLAKGDYVYFLDSDDLILPKTFEVMVGVIKSENSDLVFCNYNTFLDGESICLDCEGEVVSFTGKQMQDGFLTRDIIALAPGTVYNREFLEKNDLFFERLRWSEDQHFMWRVFSKLSKASFVKRPFYQYRQRKGSIMTSTATDKMVDAYKYILELPNFYPENSDVNKFLVARWVMGTLNATTVITAYKDWEKLFNDLEGKKHFKTLLKFKGLKVKILAFIGLISKKMYYKILNGKKQKV